ATSLKLGALAVTIDPDSSTHLTFEIPDSAVTGALTITTPSGTFTTAAKLGVRPTIASFAPGSGTVGTTVTLTGKTFVAVASVKFAGASAGFTVVGPTTLKATVPGGAVSGPITVTNAGGTTASDDGFTVAPGLTSISPTSGSVGKTVTLTGTG